MTIPLSLSEVPNETPYVQYVATNGQTVYPYPFPITQDSDLVVDINGIPLATDTGYSLSGQGNDTGGNVTLSSGSTAGDIVTLFRDIQIERLTQFSQNGGFSSSAFNAEFNNLYLIAQQLEASVAQCLQIPNTNNPAPTTTLAPGAYANKYLAFDASGNPTPAVLTSSGSVTQAIVGGLLYPQTAAEAGASVTPTNIFYPPGAMQRYGVSPSLGDNGPPINNALKCNPAVWDANTSGPVVYSVQTTIQFQCAGQILRGAGMGDVNTSAGSGAAFAPRTTLKWTGADGGSVVSVYNGANNMSETLLADICIDGNSKANWGIQGYNDAVQTGCWRNMYERVAVVRCTGGAAPNNPACIYMGADSGGGFANDNILADCYFDTSANGVYGNCAVPQLRSCTIANMTVAGVQLPGHGSQVEIFGGVFHTNSVDLLLGGAVGSPAVQNVSAFGTWFENSTTGILKCAGSFDVKILGGLIHSSHAAGIFDLGGQAGSLVVKAWNATGVAIAPINDEGTYDMDFVGTPGLTASSGEKQRLTQDGGIAQVGNAKFDVELTATAASVTGDGTAYAVFSGGVSKNFDLNGAVSATGVFTAPVTGKYDFDCQIEMSGVLAAHNDCQLYVTIVGTSAGSHQMARVNPGANLLAGTTEANVHGRVMVTLTKGDTATVYLQVGGSTKVVGPLFGPGQHERTRFQGKLV